MRSVKPLLLVLACAGLALAQPRAVLESDHFDFGSIPQGARVFHRFPLVNQGDAPLEVLKVDSACGCTTVVVGRKVLAPGERIELEVAFASAGLRGPVNKTVQVSTNDPDRPQQVLNIQAVVQADVVVTSDEVQFLDLAAGDRRRASIKLSSGTGHALAVADVELSPAPWLGVATREAGQDLYVDFDLLARRLPKGRLAGTDTITLHLENPEPLKVTLKVQWARLAPVAAEPARIAWAETAGRDLTASVTVRRRDGKPFRIRALRASNPLLTAVDLTPGKGAAHRVQLALAGTAAPGTYDEKITLDLDTPGQRALEIRVSAVLQ